METRVIINGIISRGVDEAMLEGGELVLVLTDGKRISLGKVVPEKGVDYVDGKDGVSPTVGLTRLPNGLRLTVMDAEGQREATIYDGAPGDDGVSVANAGLDERGHLMLNLSNGSVIDAGLAKGEQGQLSPEDRAKLDGAAAKTYVDKAVEELSDAVRETLPKSGGTMSGNLNMGGYILVLGESVQIYEADENDVHIAGLNGDVRVHGVAAPQADNDVANKKYVDEHGGGGLTPEQAARLQNAVCFGDVYTEAQQASIQAMIGIYSSEGVGF